MTEVEGATGEAAGLRTMVAELRLRQAKARTRY